MVANIRQRCKARGISICALERELKIGNGVIATWDTSSPRLENVRKVAEFFDCTVDELLKEEQ